MEPTPLEYIADHIILFVIMAVLLGFAMIGIFASVEEIAFRLRRRRYRKTHDVRRRTKWVKNPRTRH